MLKTILFTIITFIGAFTISAQTEIFNEDFQLGFPANFTIVDNDGLTVHSSVTDFSPAWIILADPDNNSDSIVGSTSYFSSPAEADRWLITPSIALGAFGNYLNWEAKSHDPSYLEDYWVLASRTDTQLSSFQDTLGFISGESSNWNLREFNLSDEGLDNETIHIAFVNQTNDGFKLYLDDIRVVKEDPIGLDELDINTISVSPNPSNDFIQLSGIKNVKSVNVVSISGTVLIHSNDSKIDVSSLSNGSYIVLVETENRIGRTKFIKF